LIKILINDSITHINVCGLRLVNSLCATGRKNFRQPLKSEIAQILFMKLKDKKLNTESLNTLLQVYIYVYSIEDMREEIDRTIKDHTKVVVMQKIEVCKLLKEIIMSKSVPKENNNIKDKLNLSNWFCKSYLIN